MSDERQDSPDYTMSPADFEAYWSAVEEHAIVAVTNRRGIIVYVNDRYRVSVRGPNGNGRAQALVTAFPGVGNAG